MSRPAESIPKPEDGKVTEVKNERKTGQHPADDRDSDDEMEKAAVPAKPSKPVFQNIVNEITDHK